MCTHQMRLPKLCQTLARFLLINVLLARMSQDHFACACYLESFGRCLKQSKMMNNSSWS